MPTFGSYPRSDAISFFLSFGPFVNPVEPLPDPPESNGVVEKQPLSSAPGTPNRESPAGLAIEVVGRVGSLAIANGDQVSWSTSLPSPPTSSASGIGPALSHAWHERLGGSIDYIAVADGPGSFTGLRVAMTVAKSLAFAADVPIVLVDSLAAIVASLVPLADQSMHETDSPRSGSPINDSQQRPKRGVAEPPRSLQGQGWVAVAAYRGQVFAARLDGQSPPVRLEQSARQGEYATQIYSAEQWHQILCQPTSDVWCAGDRRVFRHPSQEPMVSAEPTGDCFVESSVPWAAGVARIGAALFASGQTVDAFSATPRYFRPSAAEEKAAAVDSSESTSSGPS